MTGELSTLRCEKCDREVGLPIAGCPTSMGIFYPFNMRVHPETMDSWFIQIHCIARGFGAPKDPFP